MNYDLTDAQTAIRDAVRRLCARFDDGYFHLEGVEGEDAASLVEAFKGR